ncbi:tetratricopeptide repeat protein [bacterium]|nr:tetratricopeptide repeat protein [bacterium]
MIRIVLTFFMILSAAAGQTVTDIVAMIQQGRIAEAGRILDEWEAESRQMDSVIFLKGLIAPEADQAVIYYEKVIRSYPKSEFAPKALFRIAQLKYAQGLYQTALRCFLHITDEDRQAVILQESRYWAGLCYLALSKPDSAVHQFGVSISEFPVRDISRLAALELRSLQIPVPLLQEDGNPPSGQSGAGTAHASVPDPVAADETGAVHAPPASQKTVYAIQVDAFTDRNNALARKAFFESKGYETALRNKTVNGRYFYLVWVGAFSNEPDARAFGRMLNTKYGTHTTLVSEQR